ncbi:hypothetical protein BU17DRAFT_46922 [Hysterangium stoloniferum]|nr:hypothetical protein BU17DRAFT_46922 [Hysterangium stoloniferum]
MASTSEPRSLRFASELLDLSARQDLVADDRWTQVATSARNLADLLRIREMVEQSALGQTPLPRTLTSLMNEAVAGPSVPLGPALSAIYELLRTSANFCMDHDGNRQLLLTAGFPHAVISLLQRYVAAPNDISQRLHLSLMELKALKVSAGVLLNMSLHFEPVRDYLTSVNAAQIILLLRSRIYPPCSWAVAQPNNVAISAVTEEWTWRSGFSDWASLVLVELLRDAPIYRLLTIKSLVPLVEILARFTPPYHSNLGPLLNEPTIRLTLINTDLEILSETCSYLESLAIDSEDVQDFFARSTDRSSESDPGPLLRQIVDFVEFGDYPPTWKEESPIERDKLSKAFDMCKAAVIKTVVEVSGAPACIDALWDLDRPDGWFISRMIGWVKSNANGARDDLVICGALSLGNLARKEPYCAALVQPSFGLVPILASLLELHTDVKLKHAALGLLKHLAQTAISQVALSNADIVAKLVESEIWSEKLDMAESVQLLAVGTAKHLCTNNVSNAVQLAVTRSTGTDARSGVDQVLALLKRSDTIAVKSESTRAIFQVIRAVCKQRHSNDSVIKEEAQHKAIEALTVPATTTALVELANQGRIKPYFILINESVLGLILLSCQPSGSRLVAEASLAPLSALPVPQSSLSTSQSSQSSPISSPSSFLELLLDIIVHDTLSRAKIPLELKSNACSLLTLVGKDTESYAQQIQESSEQVLRSLVDNQSPNVNDKVRIAVQSVLDAWN